MISSSSIPHTALSGNSNVSRVLLGIDSSSCSTRTMMTVVNTCTKNYDSSQCYTTALIADSASAHTLTFNHPGFNQFSDGAAFNVSSELATSIVQPTSYTTTTKTSSCSSATSYNDGASRSISKRSFIFEPCSGQGVL